MLTRRAALNAARLDPLQLDLFSFRRTHDETVHSIRQEVEKAPETASDGGITHPPESEARERPDSVVEIHLPPAMDFVADSEPPRNQNNYRITESDKIGVGSLKKKCRQNLAALELLKTLEAEKRPPADQEKRALVRYVGWGALPQVFDSQNEEWREERERLEAILSPEELDSARATTALPPKIWTQFFGSERRRQ
jgi:hypothetical protein